MSAPAIAHLLTQHLGVDAHGSGLLSARSFRAINVTLHHTRESTTWRWVGEETPLTHAAVLLTGDGQGIPRPGSASDPPSIGLFLPPGSPTTIEWDRSVEILAIWVPVEALTEFTEGTIPGRSPLHLSPLTTGLRAFSYSLARQPDPGSSVSRYAIERLLVEMVFGILLEQDAVEPPQRSAPPLLEKARSTMLLNRENATFGPAQLAAELHISARQLQRTFAKTDTTPGDALRRMRVELAESLLRNPLYARLSIEEVAHYSGFSSALQLRRALRAEGLPGPSQYRRTDSEQTLHESATDEDSSGDELFDGDQDEITGVG